MPSSPNRRRIEIPAELFQLLTERAASDGESVAALTARLLSDALAAPPIYRELRAQRDALETVQHQLALLHERVEHLHIIAPQPHAGRLAGLPLAIQPATIERARRELLDDLRREHRLRNAQPEDEPI